jgi:hypothetical protein
MDVGPRELPHMTKADPLRAHLMSLDKAALVTFLLQHADDGFLAFVATQKPTTSALEKPTRHES